MEVDDDTHEGTLNAYISDNDVDGKFCLHFLLLHGRHRSLFTYLQSPFGRAYSHLSDSASLNLLLLVFLCRQRRLRL